jgi:hypothetical protein
MKYTALLVSLMLFSAVLPASVPNPHATYVSGSAAIPNGADGSINVGDVQELCFDYEGGAFKLPYDRITSMEITDKAGVKAHLSVLVSWVPKVGRKSGQLLSIRFKGENGAGEAAIFEVSRPEFQPVEPILEARTGKKVHYVDVDQPDNAAAKADQPAPPASPLVPVTITSIPAGAMVSFWGQPAGKTPVSTKLMPGTYTVQIGGDGLPTWKQDIVVEPGKPLTVSADLNQRAGATVAVR